MDGQTRGGGQPPPHADAGASVRGRHVPPPLSPGGGRSTPPRAATSDPPFSLPQASWRWTGAAAGLAVGWGPQLLLSLAAGLGGSRTRTDVTVFSATLLVTSAAVFYGWQTFAAWLFSLRTAGRSLALWGLRRPDRSFVWVVPAGLGAVYALTVVHGLLVHPEQQPIIREFPHTGVGLVLFVLLAVVMAPLFEEVVFRGFLFRGLANSWGWMAGALVSAVVFGCAHLQFEVFVPLAGLGFVLAWAYRRTGSLWTSIVMHALFNAVAVTTWALSG
ncbi:MAG: CAAX amino terminal protease self- immunity [Actinobacteria bacterium ADurb.BinA094]|nr:MAG: CAAX amino terminal protease self- immunity [Actinobacteria bacterium ADurb.BinA094]